MLTNAQAALIAAALHSEQRGTAKAVVDNAGQYLEWLEEAKGTRFQ